MKDVQKLLVSLDSILDTRLATVASLSVDMAKRLAETNYRNRLSRKLSLLLPEIDDVAFDNAYSCRNVETLMASRMTGGMVYLASIIKTLEEQAVNMPHIDGVALEINAHPYELGEDLKKAIIDSVSCYCGIFVEIKVVNYPLETLTPSRIKAEWACLMLYDFDEWLTLHGEELKRVKIPDVSMIVPALYLGVIPTKEDLKSTVLKEVEPFALTEAALIEFVSLHMVDAGYFSIIDA